MRHGDAVDPVLGESDAHRWLTAQGRRRVEAVALALVERGVRLTDVFASPKVRAVQTAELVMRHVESPEELQILPALAVGTPSEALAPLDSLPGERSVLLVGHMPLIAAMSMYLNEAADDPRLEAHFLPAMIRAHERIDIGTNARIAWTIDSMRT